MTTTLKEVTIDQLAKLNINELRHLCKEEGLETGGEKGVLLKRLIVQKTGRSDRFISTKTRCKICCEPAKVVSTRRRELSNGRILMTRQLRCTGKHRHTYPLKEIIKPEPTTPDGGEKDLTSAQNADIT